MLLTSERPAHAGQASRRLRYPTLPGERGAAAIRPGSRERESLQVQLDRSKYFFLMMRRALEV